MLFSQTDLRHLWSVAIGHRGKTETVATLPRGRQSQGVHSVPPQESRIFPDIQSALQKTSQVVRNSFGLRLCHWRPGPQQAAGRRPIRMAWLWDRPRKACGTTFSNRPSGTVRQSHASNYRGSDFGLLGGRHLGKACWPTNDRRHGSRESGVPMESWRGSVDLRGEDIRTSDRFSTRKSDKSIPWHPWVRSFWSS